jgi:hypothetical protein
MSRELFSPEQLAKLTLHTTGINAILAEVLLTVQEQDAPFEPDGTQEVELEIHIVETGHVPESVQFAQEGKAEKAFMDNLCGEWKGGWRKPYLRILKDDEEYMASWGKPDSKTDAQERNLIKWDDDKLCFQSGRGLTFLSYDPDNDELVLFPYGNYTRVVTKEKK